MPRDRAQRLSEPPVRHRCAPRCLLAKPPRLTALCGLSVVQSLDNLLAGGCQIAQPDASHDADRYDKYAVFTLFVHDCVHRQTKSNYQSKRLSRGHSCNWLHCLQRRYHSFMLGPRRLCLTRFLDRRLIGSRDSYAAQSVHFVLLG